jgi:hypothetical protein
VTEYIEPDDVDELLEVEGFHHRDRGLLLSALLPPAGLRRRGPSRPAPEGGRADERDPHRLIEQAA